MTSYSTPHSFFALITQIINYRYYQALKDSCHSERSFRNTVKELRIFGKNYNRSVIMGLCVLLRVLSRIVSKTALRNEYSRCFYFILLSQYVSTYLMAIIRRIVQNIKISCYFYNRSVVFSTIMCASCRQLIALVYLYAILNISLKYFVKIF
jgi:hypothetical protein